MLRIASFPMVLPGLKNISPRKDEEVHAALFAKPKRKAIRGRQGRLLNTNSDFSQSRCPLR